MILINSERNARTNTIINNRKERRVDTTTTMHIPSPRICSLDISEGSISGGPSIVSGCGTYRRKNKRRGEKRELE